MFVESRGVRFIGKRVEVVRGGDLVLFLVSNGTSLSRLGWVRCTWAIDDYALAELLYIIIYIKDQTSMIGKILP